MCVCIHAMTPLLEKASMCMHASHWICRLVRPAIWLHNKHMGDYDSILAHAHSSKIAILLRR